MSQPNSTASSKRMKPALNKLFTNKIRGMIEQEYAFKNIDRTKKDLLSRYGVPFDSKIYNYKQAETRKICRPQSSSLPAEVKDQMKAINRDMLAGIAGLLLVGCGYYGGAFYVKRFTRWGKLTSSGLFQKALVYCVLLNSTNYFILVHSSEQLEMMFRHHGCFEQLIQKYEDQY